MKYFININYILCILYNCYIIFKIYKIMINKNKIQGEIQSKKNMFIEDDDRRVLKEFLKKPNKNDKTYKKAFKYIGKGKILLHIVFDGLKIHRSLKYVLNPLKPIKNLFMRGFIAIFSRKINLTTSQQDMVKKSIFALSVVERTSIAKKILFITYSSIATLLLISTIAYIIYTKISFIVFVNIVLSVILLILLVLLKLKDLHLIKYGAVSYSSINTQQFWGLNSKIKA